jgi:predicted nucleic acid-binding protein
MMRVLLDTDVILDLVLARDPFAADAAALWVANEQGRCTAYIASITPINVFYVVRKIKGADVARRAVGELLTSLRVCPVDHDALRAAWASPLSDYEDAVQVAAALASGLDALVTRNLADYVDATIPVLAPADALRRLSAS